MVVKLSTIKLQLTRIAAVQVHSFYYNIISTSETKTSCYFAVVFEGTVQYIRKIFFRSNKSPNVIKNGFLW
jgi:hypothetical protein